MDPPKGIALRPPGEAHRIFAFLTEFGGGSTLGALSGERPDS